MRAASMMVLYSGKSSREEEGVQKAAAKHVSGSGRSDCKEGCLKGSEECRLKREDAKAKYWDSTGVAQLLSIIYNIGSRAGSTTTEKWYYRRWWR